MKLWTPLEPNTALIGETEITPNDTNNESVYNVNNMYEANVKK